VYNGEEMVAVMPLQLMRSGSLVSSFGPAGPAVITGIPESYRQKILDRVFSHVLGIAVQTKAQRVEVSVSPLTRNSLACNRGINYLVQAGFEDVSTHTMIVNLRQSDDDLWSDLSKDARYNVRQARKAGYNIERGLWREWVDVYYRVHVETYRRTGVTPHPKAYFESIAHHVAGQGHAVLWVAKDAQGNPVAFHNCARFGKTSQYWTGCGEMDHLSSGVNYLLVWHALLGAKEDGCEWYEIGECFPNVKEGKLHGLTVFKSKFGGELHRLFKGTIVLQPAAVVQDSPSPYRLLVRNWMRATKEMVTPVLGTRTTEAIVSNLRRTYAIAKKGQGSSRIVGRRIRQLKNPAVSFIKPYWFDEEIRTGFGAKPIEDNRALAQFETSFREKLALSDKAAVVATGSGRTALSLVLRVLKAKYPDRNKVLLPSYGCKGTFDPIVVNGLIPVYVDIDQELLPDVESFKRHLSSDVLACLLVHLTGKLMQTNDIIAVARQYGVATIADNCQSLGQEIMFPGNQEQVDFSIYSFGIGKNLMATAGGALVARVHQEEVQVESKSLELEDGMLANERFAHIYAQYFGDEIDGTKALHVAHHNQFNYVAMNSLDALLIVYQLERLSQIIQRRQENAAVIANRLMEFPELYRTQNPQGHIYTKLSVTLPDREMLKRFRAYMAESGVELEGMYTPLHLREFGIRYRQEALEATERIYPLVVNIPVRPNLSNRDVQHIADLVGKFGDAYA